MPARTSPVPAVARSGGALSAIAARPSGAATTVSGPFRTTTAPERAAACARAVELGGEPRRDRERGARTRRRAASARPAPARCRDRRRRAGRARRRRTSARRRRGRRRGLEASAASTSVARRLADAERRPEHDGVPPAVGEDRGEALRAVHRAASMIAVRCAALTASASGGEATVTRPAPTRSAAARREARRAGPDHRAGDDDGMAAVVFVAVDAAARGSAAATAAAGCGRSFGRIVVEHDGSDADVGDGDRAGVARGRAGADGRASAGRRSPSPWPGSRCRGPRRSARRCRSAGRPRGSAGRFALARVDRRARHRPRSAGRGRRRTARR